LWLYTALIIFESDVVGAVSAENNFNISWTPNQTWQY